MEDLNGFIKEVQSESAYWFNVDLTEDQVKEWITEKNITCDCFDTMERGEFGDWLGKKITGKPWPMYGNDQNTKDEFWKLFNENAGKLGYTLINE